MTDSMVLVSVFLATALLITAVALAIRDLFTARRRAEEDQDGDQYELQTEDLIQQQPRGTRLDRWFDSLMAQTGLDTSPEVGGLLAVAVGLLVGGILFVWQESLLLGAVGLVVGIAGVLGTFLYFRARRLRLMREQLPDAIALLARSVQAGQTLEQGIEMVGRQIQDPLAREFQQCSLHLDMGLSVEAAMRAFTRRVPLDEARIFASTLIVQRRMGGNLPETLMTLVDVIRDRLSYRRQFHAATTAPRLSAIGIAVIGVALLWYLRTWRPDYFVQMTSRTEGQIALGVAVALYLTGLLWTFYLLRPKY